MIHLHQQQTLLKFLEEEGFIPGEVRSTSTPAVPGSTLPKAKTGEEYNDIHRYQKVVGSLLYFYTRTRPEIINAVRDLSRYMSKPSLIHWRAAEFPGWFFW